MSNVKIQGNVSGTGSLTIAAPNTNTDRTLTLPDESGTLLSSGGAISGTTGTFTGLLDISASGAGQIKFPATQNPSTNANTLDDYEEGTWTPTVYTSGYSVSSAAGFYTKIGRQVTLQLYVNFNAVGSQNSAVIFSGLPFTSANQFVGGCYSGVCRENSLTGAVYVANIQNVSATIEINSMDGVGSGQQRTIRGGENYCATVVYNV